MVLEKWDRGSAVVDDTFYLEESVHRNLWNERMAAEEERCVPANRSPQVSTATVTAAAATTAKTADKPKTK